MSMPTYLIGIQYDASEDDRGFFDIRRQGPLNKIAKEILKIELMGWSYPMFPPNSNPRVLYIMDYSNRTSLKPYEKLINTIKQLKRSQL